MLLIYFDEVKADHTTQPYYWLGGIVVTEKMINSLEKAVDELSRECFDIATRSKDTEFHATEIFNRKANFKEWRNIDKRMNVLAKLANILDSEPDLAKIYVRLDPAKIYAKKKVEPLAFMYFVERVEQYLKAKKSAGMLIGDRENTRISNLFANNLSLYREYGTDYDFSMNLEHLLDTVHFTDSHHSRMLQLADLYVWLLQLCAGSRAKKHPQQLVVEHVRNTTNILSPNKYKRWPPE